MGPPKNAVRSISQEAFDEVVKENVDDLGMDPTEALQDAIQTLTLQGVDLSGTLLLPQSLQYDSFWFRITVGGRKKKQSD